MVGQGVDPNSFSNLGFVSSANQEPSKGFKLGFFIWVLGVVFLIAIVLIVLYMVGGKIEKQVNSLGITQEFGFLDRVLIVFEGNKFKQIQTANNPDQNGDGIIDYSPGLNPNGDLDEDNVPNIDDVDVDGDGILNSQDNLKSVSAELCGDINFDGVINGSDVDEMVTYLFGGKVPKNNNYSFADLNGDGQPDALDLGILVDYIYNNSTAPTCIFSVNNPPNISSFYGDRILRLKEEGNFYVSAKDPEEGNLIYRFYWGDGNNSNITGDSGKLVGTKHSFSGGGVKEVKVVAMDMGGLTVSNSMNVEVPYATPLNCDFWTNDSIGVSNESLVYARDPDGILIGVATKVYDGSFLIHTTGGFPDNSNVDEGAKSGDKITFYVDGTKCVLDGGSDIWVASSSKKITLSCGDKEISDSKKSISFPCGDINFDGLINESDVDEMVSYLFEGKIPDNNDYGFADLNGDGFPDAIDLNILIDFIYNEGTAPACAEVQENSPVDE